tara:strand:- start:3931 stop:4425 length:495 start_codon:yes stop_codon:yes gene_type:complete
MAISTSYAQDNSAVSAADGVTERNDNLTLSSYTSLTVPSGATVNGITLIWTGGTIGWNQETEVMSVNNGGAAFSEPLSATLGTPTEGSKAPYGILQFGGSTNLWGLTWTPDQANSISTKFTVVGEGQTAYHDAFQIGIHYTLLTSHKIIIPSGLVKISSGKITL